MDPDQSDLGPQRLPMRLQIYLVDDQNTHFVSMCFKG